MPSLTFEISHPCYQYNSSLDEDSFQMTANGKCIETWFRKYFTIFKDGSQWDGFGRSAHITFTQRVNPIENAGCSVEEPFNPKKTGRDAISISIFENDVYFDIDLYLTPETFDRMKNTNWSIEKVELTLNNGLVGQPKFPRGSGALISGPDPDGYEIEWHVDRQSYQFIEDFYLRFFPKADENEQVSEVIEILKNSRDEFSKIIDQKFDEKNNELKYTLISLNQISSRYFKTITLFLAIIAVILIFK